MSGDTTRQMLTRLTWMPDRDADLNANLIAGQEYDNIYFYGGEIHNVTLDPIFSSNVPLSMGGTGASLSSPGADRIMFWDQSASAITWLTPGGGLVISDTTISVAGAGLGDVTGPVSSTANAIARFSGTTGKVIKNSGAAIDDSGNLTATNLSGTNTGDQTITLTGDVTGTGTGSFAATIGNNTVTYAKIQQGTARSIMGVTGNATANYAAIQGTANQVPVINSAGTALTFGAVNLASSAAVTGTLPLANGGTGGTDAATARTGLGLGTIATQAASSVTITGGSITGITDLAIADGGTGASTDSAARANLGCDNAANITTGTFNIARLASGTPDGTKFVRDDSTLAVPSPPSTYGAVGTYAILILTSGSVGGGSTTSGSNLAYTVLLNTATPLQGGGGSPSGTWRNMGGLTASTQANLWIRTV